MSEPVSKLYAKALYELSSERNSLDKVTADLEAFFAVLRESTELRKALTGFMFPVEQRQLIAKEIIEKIGVGEQVAYFINLLIAKSRIQLSDEIGGAFRALLDEGRGIVRGVVVTAEALSESEKTDLEKAFAKKLNKQVVLEPQQDKDILGGLVVKIQGRTFDGSLKTAIRRLKETLERQSV